MKVMNGIYLIPSIPFIPVKNSDPRKSPANILQLRFLRHQGEVNGKTGRYDGDLEAI
jgi:hypothetical protein